jgi:hypothetical protein
MNKRKNSRDLLLIIVGLPIRILIVFLALFLFRNELFKFAENNRGWVCKAYESIFSKEICTNVATSQDKQEQDNLGYVDSEYEFVIKDTRGWQLVPKEVATEDHYAVAVYSPDQKIISYFTVNPIAEAESKATISAEAMEEACWEEKGDWGGTVLGFSEVVVNDLNGYVCVTQSELEEEREAAGSVYVIRRYFLQNKPEKTYDYAIVAAYPQDDEGQERKINQIIENFYAN